MRQDITWCQRHCWEAVMADRLVVVACGTTGFVRRSENAGSTVRRRDWSSCARAKSGRISPSIPRAPVTPTPWFTRPLRTSTSTMMSLDWLSRRGFLPTPEPGLMCFPSTGVMCVLNVVYGMPFTSANKRTLMRSFSGLAASSSHFAAALVKRFKPSPLDQFCRDAFCFLALGCSTEAAACSGGSLAAGAASGFLGAAFRPAFDDVFEGRPALVFGLKNCVIGPKPCSVAATWDFGRRLNGGILARFVRLIAILKYVPIHESANKMEK